MFSYNIKTFDSDALGLSEENSAILNCTLDIHKIKKFKKYMSNKVKLPSDMRRINSIPGTLGIKIKNYINFTDTFQINYNVDILFGFMLGDTLDGCKKNYLIPYLHIITDKQIYGNIRISILKDNEIHNSSYYNISCNTAELYICYDYIKLSEYNQWLENDKLQIIITILNLSTNKHIIDNSKLILQELCNYTSYYESNMISTNDENDNDSKQISDSENYSEVLICQICCSTKIDTVFTPCGHMVCCKECSGFMKKKNNSDSEDDMYEDESDKDDDIECPVCRKDVDSIQQIYI